MEKEGIKTRRKGSPRTSRDGIPERVRKKPALGEILQATRTEAGLSIRQVASQTGLSKGGISHMEQGKSAKPTLDNLLTLAELYGIDPMLLIEAAGYKLKPALPDFKPYLRQKYRSLPKGATDELADAFQRITKKYGINHAATGPTNGEDETEEITLNE